MEGQKEKLVKKLEMRYLVLKMTKLVDLEELIQKLTKFKDSGNWMVSDDYCAPWEAIALILINSEVE